MVTGRGKLRAPEEVGQLPRFGYRDRAPRRTIRSMRDRTNRSARLAPLLVLPTLWSCDGGSKPDTPAALAIHAGDDQSANTGTVAPGPPQVRVTGQSGDGLEGVAVAFAVTEGGGSVESVSGVTGGDGIASAGRWTMGTPGRQQLRATVTGLDPVVFRATSLDVPDALAVHAGDGQRADTGTPVADRVQVRVTGTTGEGLAGVTVGFEVTRGGGSVESTTATTGADGAASPGDWTMGPPGPQRLRASVAGLEPVVLGATSLDVPADLVIHAGDGQRATTGMTVADTLQVRVTGTTGDPLAGVAVGFEVAGGGGSVESATANTDGGGIASPGDWTMGDPGPQRLRATVAGLEPVFFQAFALGIPAEIAVVAGTGQKARVGSEVPVNPEVLVTDPAGTPLEEIVVSFVTERDAALTGARVNTNALGRAAVGSWTLGDTAGDYWIEARVAGDGIRGNPARVVALALPGPAADIVIVEGDNQRSEAKLPVPVNPMVRVRDSHGNGVPGVEVSFRAGGGSAAVPPDRDTDAHGFAAVDRWVLGPTANISYRLAAEAREGDDTVGSVSFTATATPAVYDIEIVHADSSVLSEGQLAAFSKSEEYWEEAIRGNLPWGVVRKASLERCLSLAEIDLEIPGDRVVDDLLIYADAREVDGPGGIFAGAGPCQIRRDTGLPIVGVMFFDIEDLDEMEEVQGGEHLDGTILHEMAHVMGFGTIWEYLDLLEDPVDPDDPTGDEDPHFVGEEALAAFDSIGGDDYEDGEPVPVQNLGGRGVVNGHWRESVFDTELMTPYLDGGVANPLSIVTLASFQDMGYEEVDLDLADDFELPKSSPDPSPHARRPARRAADILWIPLAVVDRDGRVIRYVMPRGR